jgi:2-polyprenyl-3-methyl-5-hydroxy-6-metoxy-1,4-benzoquinol methylase
MAQNEQSLCQLKPSQALAEALNEHERIKRAIALDPNQPAYYCSAGIALQKLNRWEEAAAHYQVALALKPDFAEAGDNLALLAEEQSCQDARANEPKNTLYQNCRERIDKSLCATPFAIREYYSDERLRFYQACLQLLKAFGIVLEGQRVVDVACGMGYQLRLVLESRPASLTGLDFSRVAIEIARLLCPGGTFHEFDVYQKYHETFDVVICTEALEHLLYPSAALKSILSMVCPGGCAFLTVPNGRLDTFDGHINFWSPESWRVFIDENCEGFDVCCGTLRERNVYALVRSR